MVWQSEVVSHWEIRGYLPMAARSTVSGKTMGKTSKFQIMILGESYEMEFPKDADMKPPGGCYDFLGAYCFDVRNLSPIKCIHLFLYHRKGG
jgi:hypothetical protein